MPGIVVVAAARNCNSGRAKGLFQSTSLVQAHHLMAAQHQYFAVVLDFYVQDVRGYRHRPVILESVVRHVREGRKHHHAAFAESRIQFPVRKQTDHQDRGQGQVLEQPNGHSTPVRIYVGSNGPHASAAQIEHGSSPLAKGIVQVRRICGYGRGRSNKTRHRKRSCAQQCEKAVPQRVNRRR
nr:hypothetical protein [Arthrobacter globiformis]